MNPKLEKTFSTVQNPGQNTPLNEGGNNILATNEDQHRTPLERTSA